MNKQTIEDRLDTLEAFLPMLTRMSEWEDHNGRSVPEQLHGIIEQSIAAAKALLAIGYGDGTMVASGGAPDCPEPFCYPRLGAMA